MPDPRPPLRAVQRQFWCALREGLSVEDAAGRVGASKRTAHTWRRQAGGVPPLRLPAHTAVVSDPEPYPAEPGPVLQLLEPVEPVEPVELRVRHLSLLDREQIALLLVTGASLRTIATRLDRSASTISREVRGHMRHRSTRRYLPPGQPLPAPLAALDWVTVWEYSPTRAQRRFESRLARPQPTKLATNPELCAEVQRRLERLDSPEQIAGRLTLDFPDREEMWVSHETIYLSLYVQARGELSRELTTKLRTGRALRKTRTPRASTGQPSGPRSRSRIPELVSISERPPEADDRAVPGHWEGDLILGANNASAIGTLVERTTRYVMLLHLPTDRPDGHAAHGAEAVAEAMITAMAALPAHLRRTLAYDRGTEMTNHARISAATDLDIYFCDPHSPWQRGTNENTNGLLRQYFPKGTDLAVYTAHYLDYVATELNNRPRKTLGFHTPAEALDELLSNPPVATTP